MRLFFYGTLTPDHDNAATGAVLPQLGPARRARLRGRLYVVRDRQGAYPVLVPGGAEWVTGWFHAPMRKRASTTMRQLDAWEGFDPRHPGRGEYRRRTLAVRVGPRLVMAQAYVANRPPHGGMARLPGGDFSRWATRRRIAVFGAHACNGPLTRPDAPAIGRA